MSDQQIHITPTGETLTILTGNAPKEEPKQGVDFSAIITGPADWYEGKIRNGFEFDKARVHVLFSRAQRKIQLLTRDDVAGRASVEKAHVTGNLMENPDLRKFGINGGQRWEPKELASFLKMSRIHFQDREANRRIVANLNDLRVAVEREIQETNDFRGGKVAKFEQRVKTELTLDFTLALPLFIGSAPSSFVVEVMFEVTDGGVRLWFESADLKELQDSEAARIMDEQLARFGELTIIEQA